MLTTRVEQIYELTLPSSVRRMISGFAVGISFGLVGTDSALTCMHLGGFRARLLFWMLTPLALAGSIFAVALATLARRRCRSAGDGSGHRSAPLIGKELLLFALPAILRLLFILYPLVVNTAFEAFACVEFRDDPSGDVLFSSLLTDVAVNCTSNGVPTEEWNEIRGLAWAAIMIYAVGMIVLNGWLLFLAREAILANRPSALSAAISFLHEEYEPWAFWWELVEMTRRLVLVGLMMNVSRGTVMQLVIGNVFCTVYLCIQMQVSPFIDLGDDFLANSCSFALVIFFVRTLSSLTHAGYLFSLTCGPSS